MTPEAANQAMEMMREVAVLRATNAQHLIQVARLHRLLNGDAATGAPTLGELNDQVEKCAAAVSQRVGMPS